MLLTIGAALAVTAADYPAEALRREEEGVVTVAFQVDREGYPENCHVAKSSGHPSLDRGACRLIIGKATFAPPAGAAVPYAMTRRIRWQIAREPEQRLADRADVRSRAAWFGWLLLMLGTASLVGGAMRRRGATLAGGAAAVADVAATRNEVVRLALLLAATLAVLALLVAG